MSEGDVNAKLDKIIALLESPKKTKTEEIKEEIINFMLKNYKITWLNDEIEKDIYEALMDDIAVIIDKLL